MIDRHVVQGALERMTPEMRDVAEAVAKRRGLSATDIVLEQCLGEVEQQLYALRKKGNRPVLRAVQ